MKIKTICICGSMKLKDRIIEIGEKLKVLGYDVYTPNISETNNYSVMTEEEQKIHKNRMIVDHLYKIKKSDTILVINEKLNDIEGYIGANSFLEIGFAFALEKKIFLLNNIPQQPNSVEIKGMLPEVINGDLLKIK